ncbi:MAG: type II toxin-antitoxin system VapC family toxin [Rickettsiaceae bacterium]|nr:type II toxin-antitoxin system VapC family toxin [Rickettsiaceae bacterium]
MIGVDTNVLIRYLIQDDEVQSSKATKLIEQYSGISGSIFINNIVVCEIIWVLGRGYKYSKNQIINVLKEIFATIEFRFEDHKTLSLTVREYENCNTDFADILIGKLNELNGCSTSFTFDHKASTLPIYSVNFKNWRRRV